MSSVTPATGGYNTVKPPQYVEEYTFTSTPSGASMSWIGVIDNFSPSADVSAIQFRKVGSEDLTDIRKGTEVFTAALDYAPQNSNFLDYGLQAQGGGSGTIDKSLSIIFSAKLNGTENFIKLLGTKINSTKVSGKAGEPHKVSMELWSYDITQPSTSVAVGGTVNYTSDPGTAPWTFANGGSSPISYAGASFPVTEIEVEVKRNLERINTLGNTKLQYLPAKAREVTGAFTVVWQSTGSYYNLIDFNNNSMQWILTSGTSLNLGNVNLTKLDGFTFKPTDTVYEKYSFVARNISVVG